VNDQQSTCRENKNLKHAHILCAAFYFVSSIQPALLTDIYHCYLGKKQLTFNRVPYNIHRFVSTELHCKIDAMFKRLKRYGYTTDYHTLSDLLDKADYHLFSSMHRRDHCLHHVLPPVRMVDNLRARGHPYNLPECSTDVYKKSFVVRSLYRFI